jgi:hypothetical protein
MKSLFAVSLLTLICVQSQSVWAKTDLLNLTSLAEGSKPSYGKYVVVKEGALSGEPDALDNGSVEFSVNLSGDFAIFFNHKPVDGQYLELEGNGYKIRVAFDGSYNAYIYINGKYVENASGLKDEPKISFVGNQLKIFASNGKLKESIEIKENVTYTKIGFYGLRETSRLLGLEISGGGTTTTTPSNDPLSNPTNTNNCAAATIAPNLNIKLPSASYQSLTGSSSNLWIDLKFMPTEDGQLWWTLDKYGVNE